ncbi:MAG TPA: hypothetical protein VEK15_06005 [Vicinamibacteria bacterium]|nr:hypothetical protein [Vicinamibacteria bacterium]
MISIAFLFYYLDDDDDPFGYTLEVFEELTRRSTPSGGLVLNESLPRVDRWLVQMDWQLETEMEWVEYSEWLHRELTTDFELLDCSEATLLYSRRLEGDRHRIEFRVLRTGPPLRVAIRLVTSPD